MSQNTSHAVMNQRAEPANSLDYFPTPLWATRAFFMAYETVVGYPYVFWRHMTALEPACGAGHMAAAMDEYFGRVIASDITGDWYERDPFREPDFTTDFLQFDYPEGRGLGGLPVIDFVMTNPPFNQAVFFIRQALKIAPRVAMLCRTNILEGVGRYREIYETPEFRPAAIFQFVERVPMVKGRVDPCASTATSYAWLVWDPALQSAVRFGSAFHWIRPCRSELTRPGDYEREKGSLL
jgi:hypothetical protein